MKARHLWIVASNAKAWKALALAAFLYFATIALLAASVGFAVRLAVAP